MRALGFAPAGMVRDEHVVGLREGVVEGKTIEGADGVVKHQHGLACAGAGDVHFGAGDLLGGVGPAGHGGFSSRGRGWGNMLESRWVVQWVGTVADGE